MVACVWRVACGGWVVCCSRSGVESWAVEHEAEDLFLWSMDGSELVGALVGNSLRAPPSTRSFQRFTLSFVCLS